MQAPHSPTDPLQAPSLATPGRRGAWRRLTSWLEAGNAQTLVALVGLIFLLNIAVSFPGTMMNDSINQYAEAVSGRFTDWHPPVMAWLWSKLRAIGEGPAPLFVLHLLVYWTGVGLLADAVRRLGHRRCAVLVVLAGAYPPFIFANANVIKDVGMAVALLCGTALLFWCRVQGLRSRAGAAVAVLLLAYGMLVRSNAVFAAGPLLVYALAPSSWLRTQRLLLASAVVAVLAVPLSGKLNQALFQPQHREAVSQLLLYDIAGIALHENNPALLAPRATISMKDLRRCYSPFWWDSFSPWGVCSAMVNRPDNDHATYSDGLVQQWARTVAEHPAGYLVHRLKHFNSEVMWAVPLKHLRLAPEYRTDDPSARPFEVFSPANVRFDLVRKNPTVWPVTWLVWGAVLLLFLARQVPTQQVLLARVLVASALGYTGAYFLIGIATDFRYHYWSMLATVMASLVVLPELARGWRARNGVLTGGLAVVGLAVAVGLVTRLLDFQGWVL